MTQVDETDREGVKAPPLDRRVTFAIHRISAQLARITNPIFSQHDLDLDTARIVVILLERKTMPISDLIELMLLPQSTVSHQLRRLEKRGLITRQRLEADHRTVAISLTQQGRKVARVANALSEKVYGAMVGPIEGADRTVMMHQLEDMLVRLQSFEATVRNPK